jgi:type IV fimbrial biogenesis protein FimT
MGNAWRVLDYFQEWRLLAVKRLQRGVSLIELCIGVAILAILSAMAAPSFNAWIQSSQIRTSAESIQNGLQLARAEAVRQNTQVQFVMDASYGWSVGCVTVSATCPAVIQSRAASEGSTNAVVGVTVNGGGSALPATVTFNGIGRITAPLVETDFNVTNPTGGSGMRNLRVAVSTGGQIRMCDPALSSSDPRGC